MGAQEVAFLFQPFDDLGKSRVPVEIARQEKGGFDVVLPQRLPDSGVAIRKFMACEEKSKFLFRCVPSNDSSLKGGYFFFTTLPFVRPSICKAENKKLRLAVPSMVGSLVE
ncbi:hypothetical protein GCM10011405_18350 [Rufibacter glacialis]|nr:hypothetical protein GCM10011405_18350 [Rufibacter glacialis]